METQGYPRLQGYHYEEVAQRTPVFSLQVLWCLHEEDLMWIWVGKKAFKHPGKDMIEADRFIL